MAKPAKEELAEMLRVDEFPLSSRYDPEWVLENEMGPNALWLTEWLCCEMDLKPGMRVLDMGCGRAMSSIFLAKEFGLQVWATDLWIKATDNWKRICEAGVQDRVFPVHAEAHSLPYAEGFFDAIVSVDAYHYFGTDDLYLEYFIHFLKPGGQIGIVVPGLMREFDEGVPEYLTRSSPSGHPFWHPGECFSFHTADWWRQHWVQTELVEVETAETLQEGWRYWVQHYRAGDAAGVRPTSASDLPALEADRGRYLGFVRMAARRKEAKVGAR